MVGLNNLDSADGRFTCRCYRLPEHAVCATLTGPPRDGVAAGHRIGKRHWLDKMAELVHAQGRHVTLGKPAPGGMTEDDRRRCMVDRILFGVSFEQRGADGWARRVDPRKVQLRDTWPKITFDEASGDELRGVPDAPVWTGIDWAATFEDA